MNRLTSGRRFFTAVNTTVRAPQRRFVSSETATRLSQESGLQKEYVEDADLHILMLKTDRIFKKLGLNDEAAQGEFLSKFLLSPGHPTLEWVLPSPPPVHTFEELPLIKESTEKHH